jgi:hypothetical protein
VARRISFCPQCGVYLPESSETSSCGWSEDPTKASEVFTITRVVRTPAD